MQQFTYRSARSGSLLAGLGIALLVGLHLLVVGRHPLIVATAIPPTWRDLPQGGESMQPGTMQYAVTPGRA